MHATIGLAVVPFAHALQLGVPQVLAVFVSSSGILASHTSLAGPYDRHPQRGVQLLVASALTLWFAELSPALAA